MEKGHLLEKTARHQNLDCSTLFEQMPKKMKLLEKALYEKNWRFSFYCHKNFVICSKIRADAVFLSTARNWHVVHVRHTFFCRADDVFLSSRWHFWKNCRAVEIRADAFRAVDPDSSIFIIFGTEFIFEWPNWMRNKGEHFFLKCLNR